MTDDEYRDLLQRVEALEANSYAITTARKQAKEAEGRKVYRSWLTDGNQAALDRLLALGHYDQRQAVNAWTREQRVDVLSLAPEGTRTELIDRAGLGPSFKIECTITADPSRTPSYVKVSAPVATGWSRGDQIVTRKNGRKLAAAGFEVLNLDRPGKDPIYKPRGFSPGEWVLLRSDQIKTLEECDEGWQRALADGLRIEHLPPDECRQIACQRGEILPATPAPAVEILDEPDRWAVMASRHKAAK